MFRLAAHAGRRFGRAVALTREVRASGFVYAECLHRVALINIAVVVVIEIIYFPLT
jgi:hypothetical protein